MYNQDMTKCGAGENWSVKHDEAGVSLKSSLTQGQFIPLPTLEKVNFAGEATRTEYNLMSCYLCIGKDGKFHTENCAHI